MNSELIAKLESTRENERVAANAILKTVRDNKREKLSSGESTRFDECQDRIGQLTERIAELREQDTRDAAAGEVIRKYGTGFGAGLPGNGVTRNESVYREDGPHGFFYDLHRASRGDSRAMERLDRNNQQVAETRAISTTFGAGGEFVPPLWMEDKWVHLARPGRVTVDLFTRNDLPPGTDLINLPKINTGTATAPQGTQNTAIQQTDLTSGTVSSPVITIAGGQTVSMQLVEQSPVGGDKVALTDLAEDYARAVDLQGLSGSGTGGNLTGLLNLAGTTVVSYTSASPTLMGATNTLYSNLAKLDAAINTVRYMSADVICMHPRRWSWICTQTDLQNRAAVLPEQGGPFNASGLVVGNEAQGNVGRIFNKPVYIDPSIPTNLGAGTNQDAILMFKRGDIQWYEGNLRAEAYAATYAANLSLFCRVYNYVALIPRYAPSVGILTGTGLVPPTW